MSHHSRATLGVGLLLLAGCIRASVPASGGVAATASTSTANGSSAAALARPSEPPIRTDRRRYVLNDSAGIARFTIPFRYRNGTGRTVYLPTCRGAQPPRLEKRVGDRWIVAFAPVVSFCMGVPVSIDDGETFNYTMQITAGMPGTSFMPRFSVSDVPGTYRVLWEVFGGVEGDARQPTPVKDLLPIEWRISNNFELAK